MKLNNISVTTHDDGFVVAVMDMPGRPFNVFSEDMMADLAALIDQITESCEAGRPPRGLVITSGKSSFVAGADLAMIQDFGAMRFRADWQQMRDRYSYLGRLFRRLERLPVPVVAAVNGLALGGGLELAMACHGRVCVDAGHAQLGLPEILLGLLPGAGGTQRLPRYIGLADGLKMLLGGAPLSPSEALQRGLVNAVVEESGLIESAKTLAGELPARALWDCPDYQQPAEELARLGEGFQEWAMELCAVKPNTLALYPAFSAIINCVGQGFGKDIDSGCDVEWDIFVDLMRDPVASNMVTTGFLSKTAATKLAKAQLPEMPLPNSYAVLGNLPNLGETPFRKVKAAPAAEATFTVAAVSQGQGDLLVRDLLTDSAEAGSAPELRLVRPLKKSEALELYIGDDPAQAAKALALLATTGKAIVLSRSGQSINTVLLEACKSLPTTLGLADEPLARAATSVGLEGVMNLALGNVAAVAQWSPEDRQRGEDMLAALCRQAYEFAVQGLSDDQQRNTTMLAGLDLLAVFGLGFPAWTGGPLSCLAMFRRGELSSTQLGEGMEWRLKGDVTYQPERVGA